MSTPNIEELIAELQQLANEIEISYRIESIEEAVKALQSQEERIKALEESLDKQAKEFPVLPEPNVPEGDWFVLDCYIKEYAQAYGQQCAAHARELALEEAAHIAHSCIGPAPIIRNLMKAGK